MILIKLKQAYGEEHKKIWLFSKQYFWTFFIEILLALLHPNIGLDKIYYTTNETWYLMKIQYDINDFLLFILLARVYVIFRFFISQSKFYNARSARVA